MRDFSAILLLICVVERCFSSYIVDFPNPVQNDEFCDLKRGVDEPLTSACSHLFTKFACPAPKGLVVTIPSSRVNDGVCDCCDGSDERDNSEESESKATGRRSPSIAESWNVKCPNTCEEGVVSHRNADAVNLKIDKQEDSVKAGSKTSAKQARRERYERNRPKREANMDPSSGKKSLYGRVKRRLTMIFLYTALSIALLIPLCYCLCCVPAVTNLLEVGLYKLRMVVLFLFQRFGMSSVKASYTLSKDADNMV